MSTAGTITTPCPEAPEAPATRRRSGLAWFCALLLAVGVVSRLAPLLNQDGRILRQFPTEDGYLMLTIARNLAIGNGMSTAAGTIPTNGTQPLCTFLWAACFSAAGGDKTTGAALVLALEFIIACGAAAALYLFARWLMSGHPRGRAIALLTAALWYASPVGVPHTMNCLETGTYALVVILAVWAFSASSREPAKSWSVVRCAGLGLLLGLAFWVRNDAVWLILACCLARVASALRAGGAVFSRRLVETVIMGGTTIVVALPWLIFNKVRFGSIMPISGISESLKKHIGVNLPYLPGPLAEYVLMLLPIPSTLEARPEVIALCLALTAGMMVVVARAWRQGDPALRIAIAVVGFYGAALCGFYGIYFGAAWFLSRYLFPLSAFLALVSVTATLAVLDSGVLRRNRTAHLAAAGTAMLLVIGLNARTYRNGRDHMHFQVVEWVQANVPPGAWVAATQSGTLGYFHDRTLNLDGKVNPEALRARFTPGEPNGIPQYILDKRVAYLADWVGIAGWRKLPALAPHFELVIEDARRNLGILRRHDLGDTARVDHGG